MPPRKKLKNSDSGDESKNGIKSCSKTQPTINSDDDLGENWREKCKGVISSNKYVLKKGILSDVKFVVGPEKTECHAHRLILALGSPVFEAMFFGSLAEKGDTVTIPDVSADGFSHLLRYLYSDDITFKDGEDAFKTYIAADKYCVTNLKDRCESYLCSCDLSPANVWLFLESSLFMNSDAVTERCTNYLKRSTQEALQHNNFLQINTKTLETLLCLENLEVGEVKLLQSLIRWAEHKSTEDPIETFQNIMNPLLKYIRFGALKPEEFINVLETNRLEELLSDSDTLAILKHLIVPSTCPLPDWCCTKTWRGNKSFMEKFIRNSRRDEFEIVYSRKCVPGQFISKVSRCVRNPKRSQLIYTSSSTSSTSSSSSPSSSSSLSSSAQSNCPSPSYNSSSDPENYS